MKSIKMADDVHSKLQELQRPRESMSDVVRRLLQVNVYVSKMTELVRSSNDGHTQL